MSRTAHVAELFDGQGEMQTRCRAFLWEHTPIGAAGAWPQSLRTVVQIALASSSPAIVLWGPELIQVYNDAYSTLMGVKHPAGLGQPDRKSVV